MSLDLLGALFLKPALILGPAASITGLLGRATASARHAVWVGAIVAALLLPALNRVVPPIRIERFQPPASVHGHKGDGSRSSEDVRALPDSRALPSAPDTAPAKLPGTLMLIGWLTGAALLTARRVGSAITLRRLLRRGRAGSHPVLEARMNEQAGSYGIRHPVRLLLHRDLAAPAVAGVFHPVIILPAEATDWAEEQVRAVLAHEMGHVVRRDCLINLLADLAAIMYWCNPLVHLAVRRLRSESERACDNLVIRGGAHAEHYAHLLLDLARAARLDGRLLHNMTAMARPRELESRLLAILDPRVSRRPLSRRWAAALGSLGLILAIPAEAVTFDPAPPAQYPEAPEPDRQADSLARPESERLRNLGDPAQMSLGAGRALAGPDSLLARRFLVASTREPEHAGDLVRERAIWALSQAKDGRLIESLLAALDARDWRVQSYAAWALGVARDARAVPGLLPLMDHPVWRLRAMAAYALRELGDRRAETAMGRALADPAWQVRLEAVAYFAVVNQPDLVERIRPRLRDRHIAVRLAAEQALPSH